MKAEPALVKPPAVVPRSAPTVRVVSLCCLYPNPAQPGQGLFVQRRLQHLAELTQVMVVAPFAVVQYGNQSGSRIRIGESACPLSRTEGGMTILHPRWFYSPFSGSLSACWLFLRLLPLMSRLRRRYPFEVIDTHFGHPEGVAGALLSTALGVSFTMTLRGNEPKHSRTRLGRFWMAWALKRARRVFTVSARLREFALELGAEPGNVKVVPNGIDASVFYPRDRAAARAKHGLAGDRPLILSAGALVERKGHHRIIRAVAELKKNGVRAQLAIAGGRGPEGAFEEQLQALVRELGLEAEVRFLGQAPPDTLAELMSAADVFCLASTNEGWPNVVHEALACGAPVVATDVGAIPEMLAGGDCGLIVPVNDQQALYQGLDRALSRRWNREVISAWGHARGWRQVAAEVLEQMQAMLGKN
jgi:teichuronic acid biosynthesis glycosyltransferase TuaC